MPTSLPSQPPLSRRHWLLQSCTTAALCASGAATLSSAVHANTAAPFAPTHSVQGQPLVLQGSGIRYRAIFKVYHLGLYLPHKVSSVQQALALQGPVRLSFIALRDLSGTDLGLSFIRGLQSNATAEQMQRYTPASNRLIEIFSGRRQVSSGETFAMEFVPGQGTTFFIQGDPQGAPVGDDEYFGMILRIWLGEHPADSRLKAQLVPGTNSATP